MEPTEHPRSEFEVGFGLKDASGLDIMVHGGRYAYHISCQPDGMLKHRLGLDVMAVGRGYHRLADPGNGVVGI